MERSTIVLGRIGSVYCKQGGQIIGAGGRIGVCLPAHARLNGWGVEVADRDVGWSPAGQHPNLTVYERQEVDTDSRQFIGVEAYNQDENLERLFRISVRWEGEEDVPDIAQVELQSVHLCGSQDGFPPPYYSYEKLAIWLGLAFPLAEPNREYEIQGRESGGQWSTMLPFGFWGEVSWAGVTDGILPNYKMWAWWMKNNNATNSRAGRISAKRRRE